MGSHFREKSRQPCALLGQQEPSTTIGLCASFHTHVIPGMLFCFHLFPWLIACSGQPQGVAFVDSKGLKFAYRTFQSQFSQTNAKELNDAIHCLLRDRLMDPKVQRSHKEGLRGTHLDCILGYHKPYHKVCPCLTQGNFFDAPAAGFPPHKLASTAHISCRNILQQSRC